MHQQVLRLWAKLGLGPLLATSDTNIAVDNIAEGLATAGVRVVRVGQTGKIRPQLHRLSLDAQVTARMKQDEERTVTWEKEQMQQEIDKEMQELETELRRSVRQRCAAASEQDEAVAIEDVVRLSRRQLPPVELQLLPAELLFSSQDSALTAGQSYSSSITAPVEY